MLAVLVIGRFFRFRKSFIEILYALAFLTFGLTDVREAYSLDSWLIWFKLANLVVLFRLRASVMRNLYPESRLF